MKHLNRKQLKRILSNRDKEVISVKKRPNVYTSLSKLPEGFVKMELACPHKIRPLSEKRKASLLVKQARRDKREEKRLAKIQAA